MGMMFDGWSEGECSWCGKEQPFCDCIRKPEDEPIPKYIPIYSTSEPKVTQGDAIIEMVDGKPKGDPFHVDKIENGEIIGRYISFTAINDGKQELWKDKLYNKIGFQ